jgi:hypothetical protein
MSDRRTLALVVLLVVLLIVIARLLRAASNPQVAPPRLTAAVGVAAIGGVWMLVNEPVEGPILFVVARGHGVTAADLPSVALFLIALGIAWPRRGRRASRRLSEQQR